MDGWGDTPCTPFIINKGNIIRDIKNTTYKTVYGTLGMTNDGVLKGYSFSKTDFTKNKTVKQQMLSDGVRNSFAYFSTILKSDTKFTGKLNCSSGYCFPKTVLCQVDNNNFVIFSGGKSLTYTGVAKTLKESFKCQTAYAFDGGTSSGLFYKRSDMTKSQAIRTGQAVPDMMYFVEQ